MYYVYFEESKQLFIFFTILTLEEICQFLNYYVLLKRKLFKIKCV